MATSAAQIALQLQKLSNEATEKSFQYNSQEANTARAWQKEMSDTAHQREVADLKAAGLNPVLATNNGAQSYTTSSASAQAENAANAVGNVWSSDISARATRAAAAQSAAATRYAAAAQASAARYAASLQYDAQIKGFDVQLKNQKNQKDIAKLNNQNKIDIIDKTPPKKATELVWKVFDQSGLRKEMVDNRIIKDVTGTVHALLNNTPSQNFKQISSNGVEMKNFVLNNNGVKKVNSALSKMKISPTYQAQRLFIKAFVFHDGSALNSLIKLVKKK